MTPKTRSARLGKYKVTVYQDGTATLYDTELGVFL